MNISFYFAQNAGAVVGSVFAVGLMVWTLLQYGRPRRIVGRRPIRVVFSRRVMAEDKRTVARRAA